MTRTENEQELVLGNKQLLSAFFVVVALLGVFFTMGYIIGRNTNASDAASKSAARAAAPVGDSLPAAVQEPSAATPDPANTSPAPPAREDKPVAEEKTSSAPKAAVTKAAARDVTSQATTETPVPAETTSGHTYLQVMAVKRPVADNTVKMLKERGLPALLGESSKPELFRVLVGPYSDTSSLAKAKSDLKAMGFDAFISK